MKYEKSVLDTVYKCTPFIGHLIIQANIPKKSKRQNSAANSTSRIILQAAKNYIRCQTADIL